LLSQKSKDLLVAAYLCAGLWETQSWAGLANGLNLIKALVDTHWEALHPERLRARKTAVDWLLDRIKPLAEVAEAQASDKDALNANVTLLDYLVAFGETRWEGDPPTIWSLTKIIQGKLAGLPSETAANADGDGASSDNSSAAASNSGAATMANATFSSGQSIADRNGIYRQIVTLAEVLIAMEPHSPVPYLLRRAASWGPMPLPQLYGELQRSGSMWDLVLQQLPEGAVSAGGASKGLPTPVYTPAPEPEAAPPHPRGDY
jgi:type VI secretion system protein VasJ